MDGAQARPFPCPFDGCAHASTTRSSLRLHEVGVHSNARPYACTASGCAYSAKTAMQLRSHARALHGIGKDIPICPHAGCGYRGGSQRSLNEHVNAHSDIRPHLCPKCKTYTTSYASNLGIHVKKCTGVSKRLRSFLPAANLDVDKGEGI